MRTHKWLQYVIGYIQITMWPWSKLFTKTINLRECREVTTPFPYSTSQLISLFVCLQEKLSNYNYLLLWSLFFSLTVYPILNQLHHAEFHHSNIANFYHLIYKTSIYLRGPVQYRTWKRVTVCLYSLADRVSFSKSLMVSSTLFIHSTKVSNLQIRYKIKSSPHTRMWHVNHQRSVDTTYWSKHKTNESTINNMINILTTHKEPVVYGEM